MLYYKKFSLIIIAFLICIPASLYSQQQHDHKHDLGSFDRYIPNVSYTIRAEIIPDSLIVKGMIEVEFKNHYRDSLTDILFHLDRPGIFGNLESPDKQSYMHFDSILYYGAPLSKDAIEFDGTNMLVNLSHPLLQDQKGFFLMSFTTKLSNADQSIDEDFMNLSGWYPRVAYKYFLSTWYKQADSSLSPRGEEYARHYIGLKIDSSYSIAYAGKQINEKEHLGLISKQEVGEIRVDLAENYSRDINGNKYSPVFEDGYKYYFINQPIAETFTASVRKDLIQDRVLTDNVTIDVFYTDEERELWGGTVANLAMGIIKNYEPKLGKFKYPHISICTSPFEKKRFLNEPFVLIPESIDDPELLYSFIAAKIFRLWFTSPLEHSPGTQDAPEARALNIVQEILYDDFDDKDYKIFLKLLNWLEIIDKNKKVLNTSIRDKLAWMQVSKYWHNNTTFLDNHKRAAEENRYFHSIHEGGISNTEFDFDNNNAEQLGLDPLGMSFFVTDYDPALDSILKEKNDSGYVVTCYISGGYNRFPMDIGVVTINGDTLIERFEYNGFNTRSRPKENTAGVFTETLTQKPIAVILDPNYHLPDINRSNNYGYFRMTKFRPHAERAIFPGYYK